MAKKKDGEEITEYAEIHDMPTVSIGDAKKQIEFNLTNKIHRGAILLVGEAGVGKTQIVKQVAAANGYRVCDIRTAHYGLLGCGVPSTKNIDKGYFELVVPESFPQKGEKAIVNFDEINQGQPHAISMLFSLVEDRQMFSYRLPDDCIIVACMNPATANYAVTRIENNAAIRRRMLWLYVVHSQKDWFKHAESKEFHMSDVHTLGKPKECHPEILEFFKHYPSEIYDRKSLNEEKLFPCPASIQTLSLYAYMMDKNKVGLTTPFAQARFAGIVGMSTAARMSRFLDDRSTAVDPRDILSDYGKIRSRIQKLIEKNNAEFIGELDQNVLKGIFAYGIAPATIAANLVPFLQDHTGDLQISFLRQIDTIAKENQQTAELGKLLVELAQLDGWLEINSKLDTIDRRVSKGMEAATK